MAALTPTTGGLGGSGENDNIRRLGPRRPSSKTPVGPITGDLWYDTSAASLKVWTGSAWQPIGGAEAIMPPARVGPSPAGAYGGSYASFDHTGRNYTAPGNYIVLADATNTFVNAPTGGAVFIRVNNSDIYRLGTGGNISYNTAGTELTVSDTNTFRSNFGFTMPQFATFYLRGFGDTNHRIFVPSVASQYNTAFNVDGPVIVGFANWILATGQTGQWQVNIGTGGITTFNRLTIGAGATQDSQTDFESLTTYGGASGWSARQRSRAWNDTARRAVFYAQNDHWIVWVDGLSNIASMGFNNETMNSLQTFDVAVPALGGGNTMNLQANGSWQVGYIASSEKVKKNIRALKDTPEKDSGFNSPVFKLRPTRHNWKHSEARSPRKMEGVANGDELNELHPNGVAGLIAEEVAEHMPDAVFWRSQPEKIYDPDDPMVPMLPKDENGDPILYYPAVEPHITGIDNDRLLAYLIDAVQYLKEEVDDLRGNKKPKR